MYKKAAFTYMSLYLVKVCYGGTFSGDPQSDFRSGARTGHVEKAPGTAGQQVASNPL